MCEFERKEKTTIATFFWQRRRKEKFLRDRIITLTKNIRTHKDKKKMYAENSIKNRQKNERKINHELYHQLENLFLCQ